MACTRSCGQEVNAQGQLNVEYLHTDTGQVREDFQELKVEADAGYFFLLLQKSGREPDTVVTVQLFSFMNTWQGLNSLDSMTKLVFLPG